MHMVQRSAEKVVQMSLASRLWVEYRSSSPLKKKFKVEAKKERLNRFIYNENIFENAGYPYTYTYKESSIHLALHMLALIIIENQ